MESPYITNPVHGGKVTCHKCNGFIHEGQEFIWPDINKKLDYTVYFHKDCFNRYEHYYELDRPID